MKNKYIRFLFFPSIFTVLLIINGCTKTSPTATVTVPDVTTTGAAINVTSTTAQSGGIITSEGDEVITANGVCYSTTDQTPTLSDSKTSDKVSDADIFDPSFTSNLTGLTANTVYYLRAYATNSTGTGYGSVVKFTTASNLSAVNTVVTTLAGNGTPGYMDGPGLGGALFNQPQGVAVDGSGNVYVADTYNNDIRMVSTSGTASTIAGDGNVGFLNATTGTASEFYAPTGLTFDVTGNLYVADYGNNVIREIATTGAVSTYAGTGQAGYYDGSDPLYVYFNSPNGEVFDASGNMYIADRGNNVIRKITPGNAASTLAGIATAGYQDGTTTLAYFRTPNAVAVDSAGNVYVADEGNNAIRKITPAGVVTTVAGGPSQPNLLNLPSGIALDKKGNIYITDESGRVLEYTPSNTLFVLAGSLGTYGFVNGSGASATFNHPQGIAIDLVNSTSSTVYLYVADQGNNCVRKLTVSLVQ